jgi:hypothetical protein
MQKDLNIDCRQLGSLEKKAFTSHGFDGPRPLAVLNLVLHQPHRFDTADSHASPLHGEKSETTFILATEADRTRDSGSWSSRARGALLRQPRRAILLNALGLFRVV